MPTKEDLKQFLLGSIEDAIPASGGRQIVCRCRFPGCTDKKRHLYIGPFDGSDDPIMYNCFKCPNSGYLGKEFLALYGIDTELGVEVLKANKGSKYKSYSSNNNRIYKIDNYYITDCNMSRYKLQYINDRLGLNLTYQDCIENKIVLNLIDIIKSNNIRSFTRHPNIIKQLNDSFIGFLSRTNCTLNMRNLNEGNVYENIDTKYVNYRLFDDTPKYDFYVLPNSVDLNQHIKVYVAEGPFDILSIYYNVIKDKSNSFFIAGRGKAYYSIIEYLLLTYGIYDMEVHYFPDKDISDFSIEKIIKFFYPFGIQFYVHRNVYNGEKDFGVPKERIVDRCRRVT